MPTTLRIAWRLQRWELGLLVVTLTAMALVLPSLGEAGIGDQRMIVLFLTLAGPVLFGSALGIGIVAGEIEHGPRAPSLPPPNTDRPYGHRKTRLRCGGPAPQTYRLGTRDRPLRLRSEQRGRGQ